jgi:hypothetical protein
METDCTRDEPAADGSVITPLPTGTRLLHIGPHKTGTTSIQGALFAAKDALRKPPYDKPDPSFWLRHRHDRLVERWGRVAGPERSPSSWSTTGTGRA